MEILIVIAMLGILVTIILGSYISSLKKGRDSRRKQDLGQISSALELYYGEQGVYPKENEVVFGNPLKNPNDENLFYMKKIPNDPVSDYEYQYVVSDDQQNYQLYSCLENVEDPDYNETGYTHSCGAGCNQCRYGIASPNSLP